MRCGRGSSALFSKDWKTGLLLFPILGIFAASAAAETGRVERARTWLATQLPALIAATNTPVRILAAAALALPAESSETTAIVAQLERRQDDEGFWARPGSPSAAEDQTFALRAAARADRPGAAVSRGWHALLAAQRGDGGWSPTLGRYDHADAVSTALALAAGREAGSGTAEDRSVEAARTFLDGLRDEDGGSYGYESRGLGTWGSTAAAMCGRGRVDFEAASALQALADARLLARRPRRPLVESLFLAGMTRRLPAPRTESLRAQLRRQIETEQVADGRWPAPRQQREEGDVYATALTVLTLEELDRPPMAPPAVRPFVWTRDGRSVALLLALPATEPEMMLVDLDGPQPRHLIVTCDAEAMDRAGAGPLRTAQVQTFARDRLRLPSAPLLAASNYVDWAASLCAPAASQRDGPSVAAFRSARAAWLNNDPGALERCLETWMPAGQKKRRDELQALAGAQLVDRLRTNEACLVVLDAWLACGERGVLARLKRDGWHPRE